MAGVLISGRVNETVNPTHLYPVKVLPVHPVCSISTLYRGFEHRQQIRQEYSDTHNLPEGALLTALQSCVIILLNINLWECLMRKLQAATFVSAQVSIIKDFWEMHREICTQLYFIARSLLSPPLRIAEYDPSKLSISYFWICIEFWGTNIKINISSICDLIYNQ